jgi:tripartite-type tricarboxylate transporter receptor subunit TctC
MSVIVSHVKNFLSPGPRAMPRRRAHRRASQASLAVALLTSTGAARALDAEDFYKGKTLRVIVAYSSGSMYDAYARLLAREIGNYLPGKPTVIVQNMLGGSGLKALQYLDNGAPADGTTIVTVASDLILESLFDKDRMSIDFSKFAWIGSIAQDERVCYMWHGTGIKDWHGLLTKKPINMGATGPGVPTYVDQRILQVYLGADVKIVRGYPGSPEKRIAIENGELDGDCGSWPGVPQTWLRDGKINIVLRMSEGPVGTIGTSVPYVGDIITDPKAHEVLKLIALPKRMGRPFLASGAIPAAQRDALRAAFDKMTADPKFAKEAAAANLTVSPMRGEDISKQVTDIYHAPPQLIAAARDLSN